MIALSLSIHVFIIFFPFALGSKGMITIQGWKERVSKEEAGVSHS